MTEKTEKPSYLGLLNAYATGETRNVAYLNCWAATTPSAEVRAVLHTIALREAEHGLAFEKRIDELGYGLIDRGDSEIEARMAIASSTTLTDREKFEKLQLTGGARSGESDIFDRMFENKDLDPQTGGLLGRYIAEERDTGRKFAACYVLLCEAEGCAPGSATKGAAGLDTLAEQVAVAGQHLADLVRSIGNALTAPKA